MIDQNKDLEKGIDLLLDQMPDYVAQLLDEIAAQGSIPRWQLVGGIIFEAYNNGYLSAYTLDPAWKDGFKPEESVCQFCKETFMPVRVGQLFCDNDCGLGIKILNSENPKGKKDAKSTDILADLANRVKSSNDNLNLNKTGKKDSKGKSSGWTDEPIP